MSDSNSRFWSAVGALAGVAGVLLTYVIWQQSIESDDDPSDAPSEAETGEGAGNDNDNDGGGNHDNGGDGDEETTAEDGRWEQVDAYQLWLPTTYQDYCWELEFDLDDGGTATETSSGAYSESADLTWYSCGGGWPGYAYGFYGSSRTVGSGESGDFENCAEGIGDDTVLEFALNPDDLEYDEGCLYTSAGRIATAVVDYQSWNGDAVEGQLSITVWEWVE